MIKKHYLHKYVHLLSGRNGSLLPILVVAVLFLGTVASVIHASPFGNSPEAKFTDNSKAGLSIVPASGGSAPQPKPWGYVEFTSCNSNGVDGWTYDPSVPNSVTINAAIFIDNTNVATTPANVFVNDTALTDIGLNHWFYWTIPDSYRDGKSHTLTAFGVNPTTGNSGQLSTNGAAIGSNGRPVVGSLTFTCVPPPTNLSAVCTNNTVNYSWDAAPGVTFYNFQAHDNQTDFTWTYVLSSNSYSMTGLYGSSYNWSLQSCNGQGCGVTVGGNTFSCDNSNACPLGETGVYPNCKPGGGTCPLGETGLYPNCKPGGGTCPLGETGVYPNCISSQCQPGYTSEGDQCIYTGCPLGQVLKNGECVFSECPAGQTRNTAGDCVTTSCTPHYLCGTDGNLYHEDNACNVTTSPVQNCGGYGCAGNACKAPPAPQIINFTVSPVLVHSGNTTKVSWNVLSAVGCGVKGSNGDGNTWYGLSGTQNSGPISAQTIYTLHCSVISGAENSDGTPAVWTDAHATVNVVPAWQNM
jgi:hypothetical protein